MSRVIREAVALAWVVGLASLALLVWGGVVSAAMTALLSAIERAEVELADLSNALQDALAEPGDKSNLHWADAAIDRMLLELAKMRRWVEGA